MAFFRHAKIVNMKSTRILAAGAAGALFVVAATSFASPWWTLQRLQSAVTRRDADAVNAQIDFPALRASVKSQILATMKQDGDKNNGTNPLAGFGTSVAMAFVNPLVDVIASPRGVALMMEQGRIALAKPTGAHAAEGKPGAEQPRLAVHYRSWDRFAVTTRDGGNFIFRRVGLWSWKLAGIEAAAAPGA
jgi:hypothetical protein